MKLGVKLRQEDGQVRCFAMGHVYRVHLGCEDLVRDIAWHPTSGHGTAEVSQMSKQCRSHFSSPLSHFYMGDIRNIKR